MNEPVIQRAQATADQEAAACLPTRIVLDGRHPKFLDHHEHVLQIVAGHVDVFAVSSRMPGSQLSATTGSPGESWSSIYSRRLVIASNQQ